MRVYEERKWRDGNKDLLILVPTEITVKSTDDFRFYVRNISDEVPAGTYVCIPDKQKRVRIEKVTQTKIF